MSNQLQTTEPTSLKPADVFKRQLETNASEFLRALPPHIPAERFKRVLQTAVLGNPDLMKADRKSLFESAMKAAQDGLLPDGREGALVVYGDKVQWMPMIFGILKKIRNSGELKAIRAHIVYEHDEFELIYGDEEKLTHRPKIVGDRGKPVLAYAIAETLEGGIYREAMSVDDIEKVRAVSRAGRNPKGPWVQWWDQMAEKTVLRRLAKRLPMSSDLDDLIRRDDELYDFDKGHERGSPAGFRPVVNPLSDAPQIEHDADGVVSLTPGGSAILPGQGVGEVESAAPQPANPAPDPALDGPANPENPATHGDHGSGHPITPEASPEASTVEKSPVILAWEAGLAAARQGRRASAMPAPYKDDPELSPAWTNGFQAGRDALRNEGGEA